MDHQRSSSFHCQKWTLVTFNILVLIGSIVIMATAWSIVSAAYDQTYPTSSYPDYDDNRDSILNALFAFIIASMVITDIFVFFGLYGAIKEHYCCTMTFAIYMTLGTIGNFYQAIKAPSMWASAIISILVTIMAYSFARELRQMRYPAPAAFIVQTPHHTQGHTTVVMSNGMGYPGPYQPNGYGQMPAPGYSAGPQYGEAPPNYNASHNDQKYGGKENYGANY